MLKISIFLAINIFGILVASRDSGPGSFLAFSAAQTNWTVGQTVLTSSGSIQGHAASNVSEVSEYLGIPYAVPPVGGLRFQPPVPFTGNGILVNATNYGFICMQVDMFAGIPSRAKRDLPITPAGYELLREYSAGIPAINEDCLTLNVWTKPQTGDEKKAVMVWIHGGGFSSGSSAVSFYSGKRLAEQDDVVVVSLNYRLNIFGFPPNTSSISSNLGLFDQRLAIEWVRDNIASFGGDPDRMILFGQSAGGGSVGYHSYGWPADPIVQGYIAESATNLDALSQNDALEAWADAIRLANCSSSSQSNADSCMQLDVPAESLLNITGQLYFGPTVDNNIVFADYDDTQKPAARPLLIGHNDNEPGLTKMLLPNLPDVFWQQQELVFGCEAARRASYSVLNGNPTWRYRWFGDWENLRLSVNPSSGAWHGSEILPIFNMVPQTVAVDTSEETEISAYIRGAWVAFAKNSTNGLGGYDRGWPQYSTEATTLIRLAWNNVTGTNLVTGNTYDEGCPAYPVVTSPSDGIMRL